MSTSKYMDKICIAAIILTVVILGLLFANYSSASASAGKSMEYETGIFDTSKVHTVDISMDDWDGFIEGCEDENYVNCDITIDGEKCSNVAIRAKGNTSLSSVKSMGSQRYSFKVEFDQYTAGQNFQGLDKLVLNNLIQDNTMMKDYIVYQMMADFGVDTPLCSFVYVTVNGEDWGLYLAVESVEDSFLTRNYGSDSGELYKPDSMSFGAGRGNGKDFNMDDINSDDDETAEDSDAAASDGAAAGSNKAAANGSAASGSGNTASAGDNAAAGSNTAGAANGSAASGSGNTANTDGNAASGGNMTPPSGQTSASGQTPPEGFDSENLPEDFDPENMPEGFSPGNGDSESGNGAGGQMNPGGSGMGSDDVKLKYIDDDADSYANIFDNAKTDITSSDKKRLIASLKNLSEYANLEETVDIDEVIRYFVVHNFVCNGDSYTGSMVHNYYLRENDGQLSMIPWDYNLAFGTFQGNNASSVVNESIDSPVSGGDVNDRPMLGWIFSDASYTDEYHEIFAEFVEEWYSQGQLEALIAETAELIRPYVEKDPTKFCTAEEFEAGVTALSKFVSLRFQAVSLQLSGNDTAVDTGDLNLSDMGTMGGGMGQNNSPDQAQTGDAEAAEGDNTQNGTDGNSSSGDTGQSNTQQGAANPGSGSGDKGSPPSGNGGGTPPSGNGGGAPPSGGGGSSGNGGGTPPGNGGGSPPSGGGPSGGSSSGSSSQTADA